MQRGNTTRDKMDRDEKKRQNASATPAQKLQLIKPFVVLIVIIGFAIFVSTYFVHPEFKVLIYCSHRKKVCLNEILASLLAFAFASAVHGIL